MISRLIPVKKENKRGVIIAIIFFVLQMLYYQLQGNLTDYLASFLPHQGNFAIPLLKVNNAKTLFYLPHIIVHALFSIVIVWYLYKDKSGTMVVVYISIALLALYLLTHATSKIVDFFTVNIISRQILDFISSPFKTIFSIPMLKIKHPNDSYHEKQIVEESAELHPSPPLKP
jgi:hypothetical protein